HDNYDFDFNIKKSPLWKYCGNSTAIWHCPADRSTTLVKGAATPRVRSMAMQCWMGGPELNGSVGQWKVFFKLSDITVPSPTKAMVLLDEREDSINDGYFVVNMDGFPDNPRNWQLVDYPASYHNRAAGIAFADGHSEIHKWLDPR